MSGERGLDAVRSALAAGDLDAAERAAGDLDTAAERVLAICDELSSGGPRGERDRRDALARRLALGALRGGPPPDLATRLALLEHTRPATVSAARAARPPADEDEVEREIALLWLRAWSALDAALAAAPAGNGGVQLNIAPPPGSAVSSGAAPEEIDDPELRARYEGAIAANVERAAAVARARRLEDLAPPFRRHGEELLGGAYGAPPLSSGELAELLAEHVTDAAARERILAAAARHEFD